MKKLDILYIDIESEDTIAPALSITLTNSRSNEVIILKPGESLQVTGDNGNALLIRYKDNLIDRLIRKLNLWK